MRTRGHHEGPMTRSIVGGRLYSSVRVTLLALTALVVLFELEMIRDVLTNRYNYRFGSEVHGFPYYSEAHYIGLTALHVLVAAAAFTLGLSRRDRWWPMTLQAVAIAWLFARPFIWTK